MQVADIFGANACNPMDCVEGGPGFMDKKAWLSMYEEGTCSSGRAGVVGVLNLIMRGTVSFTACFDSPKVRTCLTQTDKSYPCLYDPMRDRPKGFKWVVFDPVHISVRVLLRCAFLCSPLQAAFKHLTY